MAPPSRQVSGLSLHGASYGGGRVGLSARSPQKRGVPTNSLREGPTSPLHPCTARPQKKPRQEAGLVNGADEDGLPPDVPSPATDQHNAAQASVASH